MASQAAVSIFNSFKSSAATATTTSSSRTITAHRPGLPVNSIWTSMSYPLPRGRCLQKTSIVSNCPCQRFMVHPLKAQTSFECDGCGHHASFHVMKSHEEEVEAAVESRVEEAVEVDEDVLNTCERKGNQIRTIRSTDRLGWVQDEEEMNDIQDVLSAGLRAPNVQRPSKRVPKKAKPVSKCAPALKNTARAKPAGTKRKKPHDSESEAETLNEDEQVNSEIEIILPKQKRHYLDRP